MAAVLNIPVWFTFNYPPQPAAQAAQPRHTQTHTQPPCASQQPPPAHGFTGCGPVVHQRQTGKEMALQGAPGPQPPTRNPGMWFPSCAKGAAAPRACRGVSFPRKWSWLGRWLGQTCFKDLQLRQQHSLNPWSPSAACRATLSGSGCAGVQACRPQAFCNQGP